MMTKASEIGEQAQSQPAELLTDILDLERLEVDLFRGRSPMRTCSAYSEVKSPVKLSSRPGERYPNNARSTPCIRISCAPAIPPFRSSTQSTAFATAAPPTVLQILDELGLDLHGLGVRGHVGVLSSASSRR
jgi:hypothetical protein